MPKPKSSEFLNEIWRQAKERLPGWLYASLLQSARPISGGRAAHRVDEPDAFAKLALPEIRPNKLKEISDEELGAVWLRLNQWFANAKRRKQAVENFVNAGLWVKTEMETRGKRVSPDADFVREIDSLENLRKERSESVKGKRGKLPVFIESRLDRVPDEIVLCRDFVSIAGSAAVTEKPNDIDVVIRADYDTGRQSYLLDGTAIGVALRRFMTPDKRGPQIQMLGSPQGSFTDYIPLFDLVARKRASTVVKIEPQPPEYPNQERVIKKLSTAEQKDLEAESQIIAENKKKPEASQRHKFKAAKWTHPNGHPRCLICGDEENLSGYCNDARADRRVLSGVAKAELIPGRFFLQPKPTRPAEESQRMSVDGLMNLYEQHPEYLPAWVQKKYDGANHQIHKNGDAVKILSEDGDDNTNRLPRLVESVKKLQHEQLIMPAELEYWEGEHHFPREKASGYLANRDEPDDRNIVANVYDVIWMDGDLHDQPYEKRLEKLRSLGDGTMEAPGDRALNFAPGLKVETPAEVRDATEKIRRLIGSEGVVIKRLDSPYRLEATTQDDWIKYHNNSLLRGVVYKMKRTRGGVWTYSYGVLPGLEPVKISIPISGKRITPVGESFATSRQFNVGDSILIESETVNKIIEPDGVSVTAWVPRVLGDYDGEPDTVDALVNRAGDELVLQVKRVDENGDVQYLLPNVIKSAMTPDVPTVGPKNATIAFVGASPGRTEASRKEPFVGQTGQVLNDVYLKPLGLERSDVLLTNAVPKLLLDDAGKVREPIVEEVKTWRDWLNQQLDEKSPKLIIALGRTAEAALEGRADVTLPHPSAVLRFGDSGEVGRKLRRLREKISIGKQSPEPLLQPVDEYTRGAQAEAYWNDNWHEMLPTSGKGRFVYQHHWRGLSDEEKGLSDEQLMRGEHSVHGDLRLEGDDGLWGLAAMLGRAQDNRERGGDKLINWKEGDNIQLAPKLKQPKEWLNVGGPEPLVTGPGGIGATSEKFSKFFKVDSGTYQLGVARKHAIEIFLDGEKLQGRYLLVYAPVAGRRRWLIEKPNDQTPTAERRDLADLISELKAKDQKFLIWAKPGERPQKIDVRSGRVVRKEMVEIVKADADKKIVYGVVLDPYGERGTEPDAHNDWTPPAEIEKTAHNYLLNSRTVGLQHKGKANANVVESWIEMYPPGEYKKAMAGESHRVYRRKFGNDVLHSGAWVLGVKLGDKEWDLFQTKKINAFSPGGQGIRTPIDRRDMPQVQFVDLVEKP